jgi:opacity protein-like surface antigen
MVSILRIKMMRREESCAGFSRFSQSVRSLCLVGIFLVGLPSTAMAEWYVAGFGGATSRSKLTDVEMPALGSGLASVTTNPDLINQTLNPLFQLTQNLQTEDVQLKDSFVAGGKVGYFFSQAGLPWLGVELEGYLTNPKIRSQAISGTQFVTRFDPTPAPDGPSDNPSNNPDTLPRNFTIPRTITLEESDLRVTTVALNGVVRYPGDLLQPYVGAGIGVFWFKGSNQFDQSKIVPGLNLFGGLKVKATEAWGVFFEAKYNHATLKGFGDGIGLQGNYSILQWLGGVAFHF